MVTDLAQDNRRPAVRCTIGRARTIGQKLFAAMLLPRHGRQHTCTGRCCSACRSWPTISPQRSKLRVYGTFAWRDVLRHLLASRYELSVRLHSKLRKAINQNPDRHIVKSRQVLQQQLSHVYEGCCEWLMRLSYRLPLSFLC